MEGGGGVKQLRLNRTNEVRGRDTSSVGRTWTECQPVWPSGKALG